MASTREGLLLLELDRLDAEVETLPVCQHVMAYLSLVNVRLLPEAMYVTPQHLAVAKDNHRLLTILQKGLDSVTEVERQRIYQRCSGTEIPLRGWRIPAWVKRGLLALLVILVISVAWNFFLRRRVSQQTRLIREQLEREALWERRWTGLVENATDIVYTHDLESNFTSVNPAAERLLGCSCEEALQLNMAQVVAPEHLERARRQTAGKLLASQGAGEESTTYELEVLTKTGQRV